MARGGEQRALEGADGGPDVLERHGILVAVGEGFLEERQILGNGGDLLLDGGLIDVGHFHGVQERAACLFFHVSGTAVPELVTQQGGVEGRGRVAGTELALVTGAGGQVVHARRGQVVTGVTADGVATGEPGFEPQLLAQTNLGVGEGAQLLHGCCIGQCLKQTLGSIQQILVFFAVGRGLVCRRGFGGRLAGGAERESQQAGSGQQADVKARLHGGLSPECCWSRDLADGAGRPRHYRNACVDQVVLNQAKSNCCLFIN